MANERDTPNRDLTLPPSTYLYMQNVGKGGLISVFCGPTVVNQTGQDQPVKYDPVTRTYKTCTLEQAVQLYVNANESDYVVLENPAEDNSFPANNTQQAKELNKGRKVIIPGPLSKAIWPGQSATVNEGHRLRTNQYLVAMVYNADAAQKNWETGTVIKAQTETEGGESTPKSVALVKPDSLAVGTRIVIRGSDVSFYIPCTGVEVMRDEKNNFVREAVTLEQLEYCCLADESGKKEYPRGPKVVFPKPTQTFSTDSKGRRKFSPIELNNINGLHLKVTAPFDGPDMEGDPNTERKYREGEELFVTGKTLSIYYPREELAVIEYGRGNKKHFSTAIPKGEGRYIIQRQEGDIKLIKGPRMLLPDPRFEIQVRRVLSTDECKLMYPGNQEAIAYNLELAQAMAESLSGRSGAISEGDYRKIQQKKLRPSAATTDADDDSDEQLESQRSLVRGTKYTEPRSLVLNTKYDGVPKIEIWPGYAVLVIGSEGARTVVEGPETILLQYDEKLGFMDLSTGKPKSTDKLYRTAYLCVNNNQIGDIIGFESSDHVKGRVKVSLRVNFEGETPEEKQRWFSVDNYVKYLTDHVRSMVGGMTKGKTIAEIKKDFVNLIRETILGTKGESGRAGMFFESNGMRIVDVEVLDLTLDNVAIAKLLDNTQQKVVESTIELENANRDLETFKAKEEIERLKLSFADETAKMKAELDKVNGLRQIENFKSQEKIDEARNGIKAAIVAFNEKQNDFIKESELLRTKNESVLTLEIASKQLELTKAELAAETEAAVARFNAAKDGLGEIMLALSRDEMATKLAEATNIERYLSGESIGNSVSNLLSISPVLQKFFEKATGAANNVTDPNNRLKKPVKA